VKNLWEHVLLSAEWIQHLMLLPRLDGNDARRPGQSAGMVQPSTKICNLAYEGGIAVFLG